MTVNAEEGREAEEGEFRKARGGGSDVSSRPAS